MNGSRQNLELVEFQRNLSRLLEGTGMAEVWVGMRCGSSCWLISARSMSETLVAPPIAKIGGMPVGVAGIASLKGKVATVLDMPLLLGETLDALPKGWMVAVHPSHASSLALWWPEMLGMMDRADFVAVDEPLPDLAHSAWKSGNSEIFYMLDVDKLVKKVMAAEE